MSDQQTPEPTRPETTRLETEMHARPTQMRAWRTHRYGRPTEVLALDTVDVPEPAAGEVLVRVEAIPFNLNDLERVTGGNMMVRPEFPYSPGMEVFGRVVAAGDGAEALVGARVAATTKQAYGGFAEYAVCPAVATFAVPDSIPLPDAAAVYFPFHLAWLGLFDRAGLLAGETVLIHAAAGGSGSIAVQMARAAGATVIATASTEDKRALCLSLGADHVVDYTAEGWAATVLELTGGRGVDVVFDNVGEAVWEPSLTCTAYNGRYVMMGFASNKAVADEPFVVPRRLMLANIRLCGVLFNYADPAMVGFLKSAMGWNVATREVGDRVHAAVIDMVESGAVRPIVGEVIGFEDIPARLEAMESRATIGRVIALLPRP